MAGQLGRGTRDEGRLWLSGGGTGTRQVSRTHRDVGRVAEQVLAGSVGAGQVTGEHGDLCSWARPWSGLRGHPRERGSDH